MNSVEDVVGWYEQRSADLFAQAVGYSHYADADAVRKMGLTQKKCIAIYNDLRGQATAYSGAAALLEGTLKHMQEITE
jgi:hypothetical protein